MHVIFTLMHMHSVICIGLPKIESREKNENMARFSYRRLSCRDKCTNDKRIFVKRQSACKSIRIYFTYKTANDV